MQVLLSQSKRAVPKFKKSIHQHFSTCLPTWDAGGINKIKKKKDIKKGPGRAKFCSQLLLRITIYLIKKLAQMYSYFSSHCVS